MASSATSLSPRALNVTLGAWLIVSAFVWPHARWQFINTLVPGALVIAFALAACAAPRVRYLNTALSAYLFVSAWCYPAMTLAEMATQWHNATVALWISSFRCSTTDLSVLTRLHPAGPAPASQARRRATMASADRPGPRPRPKGIRPTACPLCLRLGKLTREDYEKVFTPLVDGARRDGRRLRLLYQVGPEFEGFTPGAAWEDAKLGLRALRTFDGCAVVTDRDWLRESTRVASFFLPCPVHVFPNREIDKAVEWLRSLPREVGVTHRLLADRGVLVIDAKKALQAQDFDALALIADPWIESHGALEGVVIHARTFPGWESLGSLVRHVQFVRDHHRNVKRIALAADGKLAGIAPRIGEHFVRAEVKSFGYDQIDAAIAWASQPSSRGE